MSTARSKARFFSELHSFTAIIQGTQNNQTRSAVLNGAVTEGWLAGAQVHVDFDVVTPCEFGSSNTCFRGTIRVVPGSADQIRDEAGHSIPPRLRLSSALASAASGAVRC
jgi:hypothetical protein